MGRRLKKWRWEIVPSGQGFVIGLKEALQAFRGFRGPIKSPSWAFRAAWFASVPIPGGPGGPGSPFAALDSLN